MFNGPGKSEAAIADAVSAPVHLLNINHREEIAVVARVAERLGTRVRVGVRVTVGEGWHGRTLLVRHVTTDRWRRLASRPGTSRSG